MSKCAMGPSADWVCHLLNVMMEHASSHVPFRRAGNEQESTKIRRGIHF